MTSPATNCRHCGASIALQRPTLDSRVSTNDDRVSPMLSTMHCASISQRTDTRCQLSTIKHNFNIFKNIYIETITCTQPSNPTRDSFVRAPIFIKFSLVVNLALPTYYKIFMFNTIFNTRQTHNKHTCVSQYPTK